MYIVTLAREFHLSVGEKKPRKRTRAKLREEVFVVSKMRFPINFSQLYFESLRRCLNCNVNLVSQAITIKMSKILEKSWKRAFSWSLNFHLIRMSMKNVVLWGTNRSDWTTCIICTMRLSWSITHHFHPLLSWSLKEQHRSPTENCEHDQSILFSRKLN